MVLKMAKLMHRGMIYRNSCTLEFPDSYFVENSKKTFREIRILTSDTAPEELNIFLNHI